MNKSIRINKTTLLPVILLALLIFTAVNCSSKNGSTSESVVNWLYDCNEALNKAQNENKPIMIDFYTDICPACDKLDSDTYSDNELGTFLNDNFVCLKSDANNSNLSQEYSISVVPTIVFTSSDGTEFGRFSGYKSPNEFYQYAQEMLG